MFQLDRHIEILLLDNDCVIVPGLGGFIAHHVSAHYDEDTNTYLPPLRTLGFNRQLQINDSLLAQSYIEAYDISYPEAIRRIESEVNEVQQRLRAEGEVELNDLGTLRLNEDAKIIFEPCEAGILTPQLYGLNLVEINPLIAIQPKGKQPKIAQPKPVMPIPQILDNNEEINDEEETLEEEHTVTIKMSTIRYAMATAAVLLFFIIFALPVGNSDRSQYIQSGLDSSLLTKLNNNDSLGNNCQNMQLVGEQATTNDSTDIVNQETEKEEQEKIIVAKPAKGKAYYSLVLASRVSKANAESYVAKLYNQGITASVIARANGCQVITGKYQSEEQARNALNTYRNGSEIFTDAWITEID